MIKKPLAVVVVGMIGTLLLGCRDGDLNTSDSGDPEILDGIAQTRAVSPTATNYARLKIAPPPGGGMYIGQYEWNPGDIATFEEAIDGNVAMFSVHQPMVLDKKTEWPVAFDVDEAEKAWQEGKVVIVHAIETSPHPLNGGFTIDKLLQGEYDGLLHELADQFRQFGKPMFFMTAREPNGVLEDYFGGFGPDGDKSTEWALENQMGLAEFDPSGFPNAALYRDLGDPQVSDGVERLIAAQRYYYNFFVVEEGLTFLTFDSMAWAAIPWQSVVEEAGLSPGDPNYQLIRTSCSFEYFYPGDEYVDWVSITWYMMDWGEVNTPIAEQLEAFGAVMAEIRATAPDKPVFIMELGFPDGENPDSKWAAEKVTAGLNELITKYPEVSGFAMWSRIAGFDPTDCLVRPGTAQGNAFRRIVEANAAYFHSCVYFTDGSQMPTCAEEQK